MDRDYTFDELVDMHPDIEDRYIDEWLNNDEANHSVTLEEYSYSREVDDYGLCDDELGDDYDQEAF